MVYCLWWMCHPPQAVHQQHEPVSAKFWIQFLWCNSRRLHPPTHELLLVCCRYQTALQPPARSSMTVLHQTLVRRLLRRFCKLLLAICLFQGHPKNWVWMVFAHHPDTTLADHLQCWSHLADLAFPLRCIQSLIWIYHHREVSCPLVAALSKPLTGRSLLPSAPGVSRSRWLWLRLRAILGDVPKDTASVTVPILHR